MEGHGVEEVWSTERMRENRHSWSLSADTALLSYIQQFSQNLLNETHTTLKSLDSLESDLNTACVEANTVANKFLSLADTQFVENRVYDDEETSSPGDICASDFTKENVDGDREKVIAKHIKEALVNGLQVVSTKFEVVEIPDSDSEEDEHSARSGMVLKPINPYQDRVLPHLIGSVEFNHDDTLGLRESQSDEETEEAVSISDKAESETEDSEPESDQTKVQENNGPMDSFRSGVSFSEQLAARLGGVGHQENNKKSMSGNMFTVPVEEDDSDSLFFGDSRSSEEKSKILFSDEQSPDLWTDNTDEDNKLFTEDKNMMVENMLQSSHMQDTLHSKYNSTSVPVPNIKNKRTEKPEPLFDDTNEGSNLFHNIQQTDTIKKKMPPGAVSIFGADVDLFREKAVPFLSTSGSDKAHATKHKIESKSKVPVNKSEDHVDDVPAVRSSVNVSKSSDSLKHGSVGLLQDEDEDDYDDLFSSANINNVQKKSSKGVSEINTANKSRNTADSASTSSVLNGNDFLSSNISLFRSEKTSLFDSSGDDLFSGDDIFSGSSSRKPFKLFDDENLFDEKDKKSDLFDDLFVNNDTTFHDNDIISNEGLFKIKNSKSVTKSDKSSDTFSSKVISSTGTSEHMVKENTEDLFSYSEPSNSNSLQNSEDGLSRKYFGSEDSLTDNTNNISGVKSGSSSTQDLFKGTSSNVSESEGIFSQTSASTPQGLFTGSTENTSLASKETVSASHSIFNETNDGLDTDDIFSNLRTQNKLINKHGTTSGTLFANSLSDSSSIKPVEKIDINHSNNADSSVSNKKTSSTKRLQNSPDLFGGEDEDDDLFKIGLSKKLDSKNEGSMPHQASKKSDNSSVLSTQTGPEKSDVKTLFTDDNDDLFGTGPLNFSSHSSLLGTKPTSTTSKSKKVHGTCPLFDDSDSDDDLFSSPRGSLGSKKSQSSMNLSQEINPVLKKNLLDDVSVRRQSHTNMKATNMENDLFKAFKNTSKNNDLFADIISDDEGNDDGDLFSTLKSNRSGTKHKISSTEKKDKHDKTTSEIPSLAKSEKNVNEVLQKGKSVEANKQLEPAAVLSVKTEFRRDSGDSLSTENVPSPGKLNADRLPKINPAALLPGTQPRIIPSSVKTLKTEQNSFPSRDEISTLQNIVKDRAKIQVKRRLPTRRARQEALRVIAVDDHENVSNKFTVAPEDNTRVGDGSMIMSPSTDEEDMFGVPPLEVSSETKVSASPTDIFSEPAIISPGQSSIFAGTVHQSEFVSSASNIDSKTVQSTCMLDEEHESVHVFISSNKKLTTSDELMDSLSGVRSDFDDRLFESNLKGTDQNSANISVHGISTEDELFSSNLSISKSFTPIGSKLLSADNSGNINKTVSDEDDKVLHTTKLQNSAPKVSHDLFDDSDLVSGNLFSSNLESKPKPKPPNKKSLFDDENEDDDIFSTSVSASTSKNAETVQKKPGEPGTSKSNNFPKRPVKLTSQQAFTDPLMSSGD